ncbi:lytic murein transglycosylase [Geoalkalibacter subterraneus]|uniref:Lytic transglycosylase n=1 Tax=Geoalkalibacter subterraneus TaxID=483547 RepID=A0A0B5FS25_9BACT|nr:lytic murein transglycosylase [Geoalkalibacter subterraneus]AJF07454.1 lytic transglycosylase [Geoalkalibacter subterraneus]
MRHSFFHAMMLSILVALCAPGVAWANDFSSWLQDLRTEARAAGISERTLDSAFAEIEEPLPRVVELDRKQPEFTQTFSEYLAARVSAERIKRGRLMLKRYPTWLGRVESRFGVQRRFLVALWGIETHYGAYTGGFKVIPALATLAYDGRRGDYFRSELLTALRIADEGHVRLENMTGSWAGAMGQCQFMPSSFARFAVDAEGDGRIDIWHSIPDVLASAANYLARSGWQDDQTWGRQVRLPEDFDPSLVGLEQRRTMRQWEALGVRRADGSALPWRNLESSLILPDGEQGPAYLVYENFRVLMKWNRSISFALAVGELSDQIANRR